MELGLALFGELRLIDPDARASSTKAPATVPYLATRQSMTLTGGVLCHYGSKRILRGLSHDEVVAHSGALLHPLLSADFYNGQIQQLSKLLDAPGNMSDANGAMVCGSLLSLFPASFSRADWHVGQAADAGAPPASHRPSGEHRKIDQEDRRSPGFSLGVPFFDPVPATDRLQPNGFQGG